LGRRHERISPGDYDSQILRTNLPIFIDPIERALVIIEACDSKNLWLPLDWLSGQYGVGEVRLLFVEELGGPRIDSA